jgi:hypothetical protein
VVRLLTELDFLSLEVPIGCFALCLSGETAHNRSVMQLSLGWVIVAFVGVFGLLTATQPLSAQEDGPPLSAEPAVFRAQLFRFTQLTKKNLRDIQALPDDDSIPVDRRVWLSAREAYVTIRAARYGIEMATNKKTYRDPTLVLALNRVDEAWQLARFPVDYTSLVRADYINQSVQKLSRSLKLVEQALVILP